MNELAKTVKLIIDDYDLGLITREERDAKLIEACLEYHHGLD